MTLGKDAPGTERDNAGTHVTKRQNPETMNLGDHAAAGGGSDQTGLGGASWDDVTEFEERRPGRQRGQRLAKPTNPGGAPMSAMPAMTEPESEFLTRREAAALARVSTWTLDAWMREEDFPVLRLGERTRVIPRRQFLEWLPKYAARRGGNPYPSLPPSPSMRKRRKL